MLDPAGEKCDLHIRAAGIFVMQLELLEIQRLVALSHNEGPIVTEEPIFATAQRDKRWSSDRHSHVAFWVASPLIWESGGAGQLSPIDGRHRPLTSILSLSARGEGKQARRTAFVLKPDAFPVCRRTKG